MAKKVSPYFDSFVSLITYSCSSAKKLQEILHQFDAAALPQERAAMHELEHQADDEKHRMMENLAREFITPIEREDIIELAQSIDEVTDHIEDVIMRIYMYHIESIQPEALHFADLIVQCCDHLKEALQEFHNFRKEGAHLHQHVVEVNTLEEEGDRLYVDTVHKIYGETGEPAVKIGWVRTYDCLEECCDACEHVANLVESIVMKNT